MTLKLRPVRCILSLIMAVAMLVTAAWPQSLGEAARQNRVRKTARPKADRVYTDDNLPRSGRLGGAAAAAKSGAKNAGAAQAGPGERLAPFVPSPQMVVERMLQVAEVGPGDTVYDMGSGDGRILIMAARKFGANAVGVELEESLYKQSLARVNELNLQDKVTVIHGDMLQVDLSPATVVTLYLLTSANDKLRPRMEQYLKKGARVVSHDFEVPGWQPVRVENVDEDENRRHVIYLYQR